MKKFLALMTLAGMVALTACTTTDEEHAPPPTLSLGSSTINATCDGGEYSMNYTIENPKKGALLDVSTQAEWITDIDWATEGVITFNIATNEANQPRTATMVVTYNQIEYPFTVNQDEYKVVYEAPYTYALSFGGGDFQIQLGPSNHLINYDLIPNSAYYTFNIFVDPNNLPTNPKCYDIPAGTYVIDPTNSGAVGTAYANETSFILLTDDNNETSTLYFSEGSIIIDDNGVKAEVITEDGVKHIVTGGKHIHDSNSTIDEDMNIEFSTETTQVTVTYNGDYYEYNYQGAKANYEIELLDMNNKVLVSLDLISDDDSLGANGIPSGSYPIYQPSYIDPFSGNATFPGSMYGLSYVYPSFAAYLNSDGLISGVSLFAGGEVIITANSDQTYTIKIAATNDMHDANTITATWRGAIEITDKTTPPDDNPSVPPIPPAPPLP